MCGGGGEGAGAFVNLLDQVLIGLFVFSQPNASIPVLAQNIRGQSNLWGSCDQNLTAWWGGVGAEALLGRGAD